MIYFDNAATTFPKPESVYRKLDEANRNMAFNAGRGHYEQANSAFSIIENTRAYLCEKANAKYLVFTPSATHALNQIVYGLNLSSSDIVYCSPYDHNAICRTLHAFSQNIGFTLKQMPIKSDFSIDLEKLNFDILRDKPKAIFCTHVSNVTGYILPIEEISKIARNSDSLLIVDGAQSFGLVPVNCKELGIDYYVFAGHKTLYGPFGIAGYFSNTDDLLISIYGGTGTNSLNLEMPKSGFLRFEPSSPNVVAIAGLLEGSKFAFENEILTHEQNLRNYALSRMCDIDDIVLYNSDNLSNAGIISFNIEGYNSEELSEILARDFNINTRGGYHCCPFIHELIGTKKFLGTVRISFSFFNTKDDIDVLINALEEISLG